MYKAQHTETSISDNLVSIITLLSVLGLHLSIPTRADSVFHILCGLERLEGLEKLHNIDNIVVKFKIIFELMTIQRRGTCHRNLWRIPVLFDHMTVISA